MAVWRLAISRQGAIWLPLYYIRCKCRRPGRIRGASRTARISPLCSRKNPAMQSFPILLLTPAHQVRLEILIHGDHSFPLGLNSFRAPIAQASGLSSGPSISPGSIAAPIATRGILQPSASPYIDMEAQQATLPPGLSSA